MKARSHGPRRGISSRVLVSSAVVGLMVALGGSAGIGRASPTNRAATAPVNSALPTIVAAGTVVQGATVVASTGVWSGTTPLVFRYQWQRCDGAGANCSEIVDAIAQTYTVVSADVGDTLRVVVAASNSAGVGAATSLATVAVAAAALNAPANTLPPVLSGAAQQGNALSAGSGTWSGMTPITFVYEWQRCDATGAGCAAIAGATSPTYTLVSADVGGTLRVLMTATNSIGSKTAFSAQTQPVSQSSGPTNTTPPSISGVPSLGSTLTTSGGSWSGGGPIALSYQWLRCDSSGGNCTAIGGATAETYIVSSSDSGRTVRVLVTATNAFGAASITSSATDVITSPSAPVNLTPPSITGVTRQGELLTVARGTWSGTSPIVVTYQWQQCDTAGNHCTNIQNGTGTTYRLTVGDVNHTLRVATAASNSVGNSGATSHQTAVVAASAPQNISAPTLSGTVRVGIVLTASVGTWASTTAVSYQYQWTRCDAHDANCTPIPGQVGTTLKTYRLTAADLGHRIFVQIKATNQVGPTWVNSGHTGLVAAAGTPTPAPPPVAAVPVSSVTLPDRLLVDRVQFTPNRIHSRSTPLVARFHVVEANQSRPVAGAYVYTVGVPFGWLTSAREVATDANGWANVTFRAKPALPLRRGTLVVMFVRARKPGENPLAGVSSRRLVSVQVG